MPKLATLVFAGVLLAPGATFGQGIVVTSYALPAVRVVEPVTTVTTYSVPAVTTVRAAPVVGYYDYYAPATVVRYREPLLRPRATVVRAAPAAVYAPVVSYAYPLSVFP